MFKVALYQPDIPHNTGNISRLCVGSQCSLHLVKPLGFSLEDKQLKRAGLDHWPDLQLTQYESLEELISKHTMTRTILLTKRGKKMYWDHDYQAGDLLLFGSETRGLPLDFLAQHKTQTYALPIIGPVRSLNLANSVAAVVYEGLRQLSHKGHHIKHKSDWNDTLESFDITR